MGNLGVGDVIKQSEISNFHNFDVIIGFLVTKNLPLPNFRSNPLFARLISIYPEFGQFWRNLEVSDVIKQREISKFHNFDVVMGFLVTKNLAIPIFRSNPSFARLLYPFIVILGHFG